MRKNIRVDCLFYGIYAAIVPLNMILNFTGNTINKQIGILTSALMLIYIFIEKKQIVISNINFGLILFLVYSILSYYWSVNHGYTLDMLSTLVSLYLLYLVGTIRRFNYMELNIIIKLMIFVSMAIPFFLTANEAISHSRGTLTSRGGVADQNGLAINMAFVAALSLYITMSNKNKGTKALYTFAFILITIGIVLTGSRGALLGLVISSFYLLFKSMPELKNSRKFWIRIFYSIIIIILIILYLRNNISDSIINRFRIENVIADKGSGRLEIWYNLVSILKESPMRLIFGYGFGTTKIVYHKSYGITGAAHNVFLQLIVEVGIIGLIFFVYSFAIYWRQAKKNECYISSTLLIILFIAFSTLSFLNNKGCWNVLLLNTLLTNNYAVKKNNITKREFQ